MNLTIGEIAASCGGRLTLKNGMTEEQKVSCVVLDSRQIEGGGVFIATVGERVDGHKFIPQVFAAGASLVITEKEPAQVEAQCGVPAKDWGSYLLVENSFQALKDLGEYYRSTLKIPVIGITGSVGKTSTKECVAGVLSAAKNVFKTEGNFNNEVGVPLTLLRIREEHEAAVIEMGISDFGEMHRLSKMARPDICVITNIGQAHLEQLKDRDGILRAKSEIFDYMAADGEVCLCGEDDKLQTVETVRCGSCLPVPGAAKAPHFFGLGGFEKEEVRMTDVRSKGLWGSEARLCMGEETVEVNVPLPGMHAVINAAAAACVARLVGLTGEEIAGGLECVQTIRGRNHLIRTKQYTIVDDCYNANPVSMKSSIDLLKLADGYKTAILGDMFELGEDSDALHAEVGEYAARAGLDCIVCVGKNAEYMYDSAFQNASGKQKILYYPDLEKFMRELEKERESYIPEGGTVLVKASHGMAFSGIVEYLSSERLTLQ